MADPTTDVTTTQALAAAEATVDRFAPDAPDAIKLVAVESARDAGINRFPADGSTNVSFERPIERDDAGGRGGRAPGKRRGRAPGPLAHPSSPKGDGR